MFEVIRVTYKLVFVRMLLSDRLGVEKYAFAACENDQDFNKEDKPWSTFLARRMANQSSRVLSSDLDASR